MDSPGASWYPAFLEWWKANVKNESDARYGNEYYQQLVQRDRENALIERQKAEQREAEKRAEKRQNMTALATFGGAAALPWAQKAIKGGASKLGGLLGLGSSPGLATPEILSAGRGVTAAAPAVTSPGLWGTIWGGGGGVGGGGAGGAAASGTGLLGGLGSFLPAAGIAAGALVGLSQLSGVKDAIKGKDLDTKEKLALALPTGGLSLVSNMWGSGKDKDQQARDSVRAKLLEAGNIDENYNLSIGDRKFDIGRDGSQKIYNVDFENPLAAKAVSLTDPLAQGVTGENEKLKSDFSGMFANAILEGANTEDDIMKNYEMLQANFAQPEAAPATAAPSIPTTTTRPFFVAPAETAPVKGLMALGGQKEEGGPLVPLVPNGAQPQLMEKLLAQIEELKRKNNWQGQ